MAEYSGWKSGWKSIKAKCCKQAQNHLRPSPIQNLVVYTWHLLIKFHQSPLGVEMCLKFPPGEGALGHGQSWQLTMIIMDLRTKNMSLSLTQHGVISGNHPKLPMDYHDFPRKKKKHNFRAALDSKKSRVTTAVRSRFTLSTMKGIQRSSLEPL